MWKRPGSCDPGRFSCGLRLWFRRPFAKRARLEPERLPIVCNARVDLAPSQNSSSKRSPFNEGSSLHVRPRLLVPGVGRLRAGDILRESR